ncbi:enoyl-CoA hydratase-related protein [Terricaulis silvestris]|uniref:2,3-dehydroadipyl-CoA hydratase n=1 Tax=Terricaulis silvestris TaxID=2686094 RepID=A0A6I6MJT6_9CAUL|nr:enoyl-CoA hydratase-related protein [Terricaulis silvestris]QGZ93336.1 2,3-dehydroadipyl-CoA hydratase [Terricaulis silvestris]
MTEHVKATTANDILTLVIDRPDKKNALTNAMYGALADALERAEKDSEVAAILIRGEGDMFTAGNDVSEFAAGASDNEPPHVGRFLRALIASSRPVVAAVQGRAVGVGTTMLLHCDYVILAEGAQLTTPFVNLALVPEAASSLLLPSRIGHARAFAMFALGEPLSAQDALAWGIANKVAPASEFIAVAEQVAARLAKQPLGAVMATKRLMRDAAAMTRQMEAESEQFQARLASPEAQEAFAAFAQRRAPDFSRFRRQQAMA